MTLEAVKKEIKDGIIMLEASSKKYPKMETQDVIDMIKRLSILVDKIE